MIRVEDIEVYLPKYLTPDSKEALFEGLKQFPENIDGRMYTNRLANDKILYQGDGLRQLPFLVMPKQEVGVVNAIVVSNSCDISLDNTRRFPATIVYAPVLRLENYRKMLLSDGEAENRVNDHIDSIKRQEITQFFFLPAQGRLEYDGIVLLDRLITCDNSFVDRETLPGSRLFSLSDYGHYLLLVKISMHFCRLNADVDRGFN